MERYDVVIVGGGPAGGSAAIFLAKAGLNVLVCDSGQSITKKAWVENHYGIGGPITGPELIEQGKKQAIMHGAQWKEAQITDIRRDAEHDALLVQTEAGETYETRQVILTTGLWTDLAEKIGLKVVPGREPRIKSIIEVDKDGRTGVPGIWAAGTVAGVSVHTIITSGDGARVAINLLSELKGERHVDHDLLGQDGKKVS